MDYVRKKRWIRYQHLKCKMYLRNDFRFECAYCRMKEWDTGALLEEYFEKDHYIARASGKDIDLDAYDNMMYACSKCNGIKSDKGAELLLNPCKDNIYQGTDPHVKNLGRDGQYQLAGNTPRGWQYINSLQLNSRFYREMRERQERWEKGDEELEKLLREISGDNDISKGLLQKLRMVCNNYLIQANGQQDAVFRCGSSKAGQAFREVLKLLDELYIPYELLFEENDLDIRIEYKGIEYLCEIVLNDKAVKPVKSVRMGKGQRECWAELHENHGILYYYMKTGRLEFYRINEENKRPVCLKDGF